MKTYIYPQNLKAKPHLWLWGMRDFVILAIAALLWVVLMVNSRLVLPLAGALCFASAWRLPPSWTIWATPSGIL